MRHKNEEENEKIIEIGGWKLVAVVAILAAIFILLTAAETIFSYLRGLNGPQLLSPLIGVLLLIGFTLNRAKKKAQQ